ncbi:MAG: PIN domain-containing protein [Treponema sp.]|nr:PIN domain-containing protein [Treponema sp.]
MKGEAVRKTKIYLDNCCYNRPYDDQVQPKVILETLAKLYIQERVLKQKIDLVWSYVLKFENSRNVLESKRAAIAQWEKASVEFVGKSEPLVELAREVEKTGIKPFDALHIACAIMAHCDCLITVDKRMPKYRDDRIVICNPVDFINREAENDE